MKETEMAERIIKIETVVSGMSDKLDTHIEDGKTEAKDLALNLKELRDIIESAMAQMDEKKANKWCENAFIGLVVSLLLGTLAILLTFILGKL